MKQSCLTHTQEHVNGYSFIRQLVYSFTHLRMKQIVKLAILLFLLPFLGLTATAGNSSSQQVERNISGIVWDENGEAIIGANVVVPGTSTGAITDLDGKFRLNVPEGKATIKISYLGYEDQEIDIANKTNVIIRLIPSYQELDELVVIGYGTVKKRDLTGSVASVKSRDILNTPTANAIEAIQGKVTGLDIVRTSGQAGKTPEITLRGRRSISGSNEPLFIIDGMSGGSYADLNPNDIETIDILKDASATAIYGYQGSNGVIIITTKKGKLGKTKVTYNGYFGANTDVQYPKPLTGEAFMNYRREAYRTIGSWNSPADDVNAFSSDELQAIKDNKWVNWIDLVTRTGTHQSHSVSIQGGGEKTKSFLSVGYYQEQGIFPGDEAERYTARLNVDHEVNKYIKAGVYSQLAYWDKDQVNSSILHKAAVAFPLATPYDDNGEIVLYPMVGRETEFSPLADYAENKAKSNVRQLKNAINGYLEITPFSGFSFRSNAGANLAFTRTGSFYGNNSLKQTTEPASATIRNENSYYLTWDNILNYRTTLNKSHSIAITALSSWTKRELENSEASNSEQSRDTYLWYNLEAGNASLNEIYSGFEMQNTMSYAGRLEYNYKSKYLFTASIRTDGASQLSENNKWHTFPSVSGAWVVSEEKFMENTKWAEFLKLRANWGISGNAAVGPYATQTGLDIGTSWGFSEIAASTFKYSKRVGNEFLTWEKSTTYDIGLDYGILKNKINLSLDYYYTRTKDILMERDMPTALFGVDAVMWQNIATTENRGFEIALNANNFKIGNVQWSSTITFSKDNEKIVDLIDGRNIIALNDRDYSLLLDKPINSWWDLKKIGIWQLDEADEMAKYSYYGVPPKAGDIKIYNASGDDYEITDEDEVYVGSNTPKWIGGFQNTFQYKGFDLSVYMFARWGQTIAAQYMYGYNPAGAVSSGNGLQQANIYELMDYWTPENPTNDFPRPAANTILPTTGRSLYFIDGSYFKIKTLTLGYTLPSNVLSKFGINNLRLYVTANNLFTKAKSHLIMNYDPEGNGNNEMPLYKTYVAGVSLTF
jgi:TonB-linked SusC/RagA family outer membrane protein